MHGHPLPRTPSVKPTPHCLWSLNTNPLPAPRAPALTQIEHHLFPAVSPVHYPAIAGIVADECSKRGIPYTSYPHLAAILPAFLRFMKDVGRAEQEPASKTAQLATRL